MTRAIDAPVAPQVYPPSDDDIAAGREWGGPNPAQRLAHRLPHGRKMYVGGWGAGKTSWLVYEGRALAQANPGATGILTAPKQAYVENAIAVMQAFDEASYAASGRRVRYIESVRRSPPIPVVRFADGGQLLCISGWHPESLIAYNAAYLLIEEAEWFPEDVAPRILQLGIARIRQRSNPAMGVHVGRLAVCVATTARSNQGIVREVLDRARETVDPRTGEPVPIANRWGVVKAPTSVAIGYGVKRAYYESLRSQFDDLTYRRTVLCEIGPPPGAVYAEQVDPERSTINLGEYGLRKDLPLYIGVDWGLRWPHWVAVQREQRSDTDIVVAEWGQDGQDVVGTVESIKAFLRKHSVAVRPGAASAVGQVCPAGVWIDPTDNPGEGGRGERHALSDQGRRLMQGMGWRVDWPRGEERSIQWGVSLVSLRLKRADGVRRLLFSSRIATGRRNNWSETDRGIWRACCEGYRRKTHPVTGEVLDEIDHDRTWSHAADALRYVVIGLNPHEHLRVLERLRGA